MTDLDRQAAATGQVVADMQHWLERAVIGLNLCPFAKAVHARGQIHYEVSWATQADAALLDLRRSLDDLLVHDTADRDTTLLVLPACFIDFLEFNAFLAPAQRLLRRMALEGSIQIASFHPDYQFADTLPEAITNYTNRAPYAALHLLRESSVARAVQAFPATDTIYQRNIEKMQQLGHAGWQALGVRRSVCVDLPATRPTPNHGKIAP